MSGSSHSPGHAHGHSHGVGASGVRLLISCAITLAILVAQGIGAVWSGSLALAADTGHVAVDSLGLVIAALASRLIARPASSGMSYGLIRVEGVAAAIQSIMIFAICVVIGVEAVGRLWASEAVDGWAMSGWAVAGLVGNIVVMIVLSGKRNDNLNIKAAFLEVAIDAASSVAVIVGGALVAVTGLTWIDVVISLVIALAMVPRAWVLLRQATAMLLDSVPSGLSVDEIREHIEGVAGVEGVHDLHIWQPRSGFVLVTAHVIVADDVLEQGRGQEVLTLLHECMLTHFPIPIEHATFQVESQAHSAGEVVCH